MAISAQHTKFVYPDYVSPLPAEDLIKVALRKQEQFDQNVTKVQSQLDIYGQLKNNIYNEGEKAYFDETMTKLVKAVNDSAGIDFSKTANVQAVLNIGKPLEKDGVIVNSIQNGKEIQRRQKTLSELDQSKRGPANDWFYMQDAYDYMRSTELGTSIAKGKEYNEFVDISDKVMEYVKTLSKEQQNEFYSAGKGTPTGYIEKISQQGFQTTDLANRIKGLISADPKAMQQLQIDTRYNFAQLGKENAYRGYIEDMTIKEAAIDNETQKTSQELQALIKANEAVKSPTTETRITALKQNLTYLQQVKQQLNINSNKSFEEFDVNDYYEIYENKFITNLSNTYATQKISRELKNDKVWDEIQKINFENQKASIDIKKEKAKMEITSLDPSKLLEEKTKLYKLYNVDPEDVFNVPNFFAPKKDSKGNSVFNIDNERVTVGELINDSNSVRNRVPLGGPKIRYKIPIKNEKTGVFEMKSVELNQREFIDEFFKSLKELQPNNVILVTTTTGETKEITAEGFNNLKASDLGYIANIAISTPYSDKGETSYKERRKAL
jgi:hypothetical protein